MMNNKNKIRKVELTQRGKIVMQLAKEDRQDIVNNNDGQLIPEPWYYRYLDHVNDAKVQRAVEAKKNREAEEKAVKS
jgi:hypothetical protein